MTFVVVWRLVDQTLTWKNSNSKWVENPLIYLLHIWYNCKKSGRNFNKKHSENADTSTSVTSDLDVWPWPCQNAYIIRCRLLYCTLVPGMVSVSEIVCKIWPLRLVHFCDLWPSPVTFHFYPLMDVMLLCIGSKSEVCRFNRFWDMDNCLEKT